MCQVCTKSSPFRSNLNTGYITGLDMCKVCTRSSPVRRTLNHGDVRRKEEKMQVGFQPVGLNFRGVTVYTPEV